MRYVLQDTDAGFRFSVEADNGRLLRQWEALGSHTELSRLYSDAERVSHRLRSETEAPHDPA